jgi:ABC-type glycerol-3-phosphate transport system substrate-binding protein
MPDEEIKSPLPPRRFSTVIEEDEITPAAASSPTVTKVTTTPVEPQPVPTPAAAVEPTETIPVKKKSKLPLILGIGIGLIVIFGLVFGLIIPKIGKGKVNQVTLNYWGLWEDPAVIEGIIADYENQNPGVKINYVRNEITNYRSRLQTRLETDTGSGDAPDIFRIHSSWLPMFAGDLAKVPTATATSIGLDSDYFGTYQADLKTNGSWMAVPLMYDGLSLFYNKDLIDSAQVTLPKSWWDLETAAKKLTVRDSSGKITVAGAALGLTDNVDHWSDILGLMMKQSGVDVLASDDANNTKLENVLTYYTLFVTNDHVWDESLPNSTQFFANGKLAFYFGPSWSVFNIEDTKVPGLKYAITTVPQLPTLGGTTADQSSDANLTNINWSSYWVEGVNPKSKNQAEAWKFLAFLSTKENLQKQYTAASQLRSFGEIYPRKSMVDSMNANPQIQPFVAAADTASNWYLSSNTDDAGLNDTMISYFGNAINSMVSTNKTADAVVPDLRNGINQLIQKYGLGQ